MKITKKSWNKYIKLLSATNETAAKKMQAWISKNGYDSIEAMVDYAYSLTTSYGETAASLACEMYDEVAAAQGAKVKPAEPADTLPVEYVDKAVRDQAATNPEQIPSTVSRMVKQTASDTTLKNAKRDGAYFAWIPSGDTCAFCRTIASNGWVRASHKTVQGDHADHIHANCNCEFAISFHGPGNVEGYDPDAYLQEYYAANGDINAMRRADYSVNKDKINAQKRAAYAKRRELFLAAERRRKKPEVPSRVVDFEEIRSNNYYKDIENLGETQNVSRTIREDIIAILEHTSGNEYEGMTFIDSKTGKHEKVLGREKKSVTANKAMRKLINNADEGTIIAIHNHGNNALPSYADLEMAMKHKYKYGLVACHNGKIFKYQVIGTDVDLDAVDFYLDSLNDLIYAENVDLVEIEDRINLIAQYGVKIEVVR